MSKQVARWTKKPVTIEAIKWTGHNLTEVQEFCSEARFSDNSGLTISTLEGILHASCGDYIIKGVKGEFYPCKPDIFIETYNQANAAGVYTTTNKITEYGVDWDKIEWLLCEHHAVLSYGLRKGCLCGSCNEYVITIGDEVFTGDSLREAVDKAVAPVIKKPNDV